MKTPNRMPTMAFASPIVLAVSSYSARMPPSSKASMVPGTVGKYIFSSSVPAVSDRKATPKTKRMTNSKQRVKNTERTATTTPLITTSISGRALTIRTKRPIRLSRMSLKSLRIDVLPRVTLFLSCRSADSMVRNHVSSTKKKTRAVSKMNQKSFMASCFRLNDPKRMSHSTTKNAQKLCSMSWKIGSASLRIAASLKSTSIADQIALKPMTARVTGSNHELLAIFWHHPVVW
mmetsp:Transcript_15375/g.34949  ORF Transcript_15375/g.34949 Transcript_15375/m.34949 type:complete len:233 (-) Transcript_15375:723-1421(-)